MASEKTTDWPPEPSPREMIDWLAFFVAPQCTDKQSAAMYMAVRNALVQHFGMKQPATAPHLDPVDNGLVNP